MLQLKWVTCGNDYHYHWCSFDNLNLDNINGSGVYIIWHTGNPSHAVRIGQGIIADRIREHRQDPKITRHRTKGELFITWAIVARAYRDGVEGYLASAYSPLEGERYPEARIQANLPGE